VTTNETTATPTPWPTRDQVITALGTMQDRDDLHPNWRSVLGRLRPEAERHTALRAARELLERERQALAGETGTEPVHARPSADMAIFDAIAKVGELETMALCRYVRCGQAALELVAAGGVPVSSGESLPGERPRVDGEGSPLLPEPGEGPGDLRVSEALAEVPGVDLLHMALRQFAAQEWEDAFGCNEYCDELEDGCGGGPHIPEHMIDEANQIERERTARPSTWPTTPTRPPGHSVTAFVSGSAPGPARKGLGEATADAPPSAHHRRPLTIAWPFRILWT
jgi:hypothetical protein